MEKENKNENENEQLTKAEKNALRKKERKEYLARKKLVMDELEPHNRQKIVFVKGMLGFYSCFGTGAIILHKLVLPRVDRKARILLRKDSDWTHQAKYGVVSVKDIEAMKKKILDYPEIRLVKESEEFVSFALKEPLSDEEFARLLKKDEIARQSMLRKLTRTSPMQNVFAELLELVRIVDRLERHHTEKMMFELYGRELEKCVTEMMATYMRLARKEAEKLPSIARITEEITRADAILVMIDEVGCWTHGECAEVGEQLAKLSRMMVAEERKVKVNEAEDVAPTARVGSKKAVADVAPAARVGSGKVAADG